MEILTGFKPRQIEWHEDPRTREITGNVGYRMECLIIPQYGGRAWCEMRFSDKHIATIQGDSIDESKAKMQAYFEDLCRKEIQYYFESE